MGSPVDREGRTAVDFLKQLDFKIPIKWTDRTGTCLIGDGKHAKLELDTYGTHRHYPGMRVSIMHKRNGKLDTRYFLFDNYLDITDKGRKDNRQGDYPLGRNRCFEVIQHCGWGWYIALPKTTRPFCQTLEGWIDEWRETPRCDDTAECICSHCEAVRAPLKKRIKYLETEIKRIKKR